MPDAPANLNAVTSRPLLEVQGLSVHWTQRYAGGFRQKRVCRAVDGVSFSIPQGATLGLVGESGCGKTTLARAVLRLIPATSGNVLFDGENLMTASGRRMRALRRQMQIVFQDPHSSLNPRMTVGDAIAEPLRIQRVGTRKQRVQTVARLLQMVSLPEDAAQRYPHEFSGGQRQRIGIARALALNPRFIVWDEPVSALDVSIQSQLLNLMQELKRTLAWTGLFIAHNLAVVKYVSDRIAVMYLGRIVEMAHPRHLFERPLHPYTQMLLSAVLEPGRSRSGGTLAGEPPNPFDPPPGCRFHPRCSRASDECRKVNPELKMDPAENSRLVACHHPL